METYKYGENSLIRSMGFNPYKIESILKNGILSKNKAMELGISLSRNYNGYNLDDYISLTRPFYSNKNDERSCYYSLIPKNVNLIIENQPFLYDQKYNYFNHPDEVLVEDIIPNEKFTGLVIPENLRNRKLMELPMINVKTNFYINIKENSEELIKYLNTYGHEINKEEYHDLMEELKLTIKALNQDKDNEELKQDFFEIKIEISAFLAEEVQKTFDKLLGKENTTLQEMIEYLNYKTLGLPIYTTGKEFNKKL